MKGDPRGLSFIHECFGVSHFARLFGSLKFVGVVFVAFSTDIGSDWSRGLAGDGLLRGADHRARGARAGAQAAGHVHQGAAHRASARSC